MKLIEGWRSKLLRWWVVRVQIIGTFFTIPMMIDPTALLSAWNMMPPAVRDILPGSMVRTIAIILFSLQMLTIILRPIAQKWSEKSNAEQSE